MRAAILLILLAGCGGCGLTEAAHLLQDATNPPADLRKEIAEQVETIAGERVRIYRLKGTGSDAPALLLIPGAVEQGIDESRFVALARSLAKRGLMVATLDLPSLRSFRIDAEDPARIAKVLLALPTEQPVSLAGISIGGSYCLVAATRPEVKDRVRCILSFGGYFDLEALLREWLTAPRPQAQGLMDPLGEGRRAVLRGNRDRIDPTLYAGAMESDAPLTAEHADAVLAGLRSDLRALSPARLPPPHAERIFLLHGENDPIVPVRDARRLADQLRPSLSVRLLVSDLFSHVPGSDDTPGLIESLPLLRFTAAFLRAVR